MADYDPKAYWSERLTRDFTLRGTGHVSYSAGYNRWLYRAKERALRRALAHLPERPARALDIGSGTGWCIERLKSVADEVEGCDVTAVAVERLAERFPSVTFFEVELGRQPLPREANTFQLVTAMDVLYHVTDDETWESGLGELARVLTPGGHLVVTDTMGPSDVSPSAHVRFRSLERWVAAAEGSGLRVVKVLPLYRWLSRDPGARRVRLPGRVRGPLEYALDTLGIRSPHMRCALLQLARDQDDPPTLAR